MVHDRTLVTSLRRARAIGDARPSAVRVAVVGGGASGVITALHLLRAATPEQPVDVCLLEREPRLGPGLAYRHDHPRHTLNNYAGRLSAVAGDPDHLVRWCRAAGLDVGPTDFLSRTTYGAYLTDLVENAEVPAGSALGRVRGTVRDVRREDDGVHVHLTGGWSVVADAVVLALGNPPPARLMQYAAHAGYLPDPSGFMSAGVNKALAYIDEHLTEPFAEGDLAAIAGRSPSAFSRSFRRHTGMGVVQYVNRLRINLACQLLMSEPRRPVTEICFAVGYGSLGTFSILGLVPSLGITAMRR